MFDKQLLQTHLINKNYHTFSLKTKKGILAFLKYVCSPEYLENIKPSVKDFVFAFCILHTQYSWGCLKVLCVIY